MRTGFSRPLPYTPYALDLWTEGDSIDQELGFLSDLSIAHAAYAAAVLRYPGRVVTLRQGARVIAISKRRGEAGPSDSGRSEGAFRDRDRLTDR